jgi:hypothetical protein
MSSPEETRFAIRREEMAMRAAVLSIRPGPASAGLLPGKKSSDPSPE